MRSDLWNSRRFSPTFCQAGEGNAVAPLVGATAAPRLPFRAMPSLAVPCPSWPCRGESSQGDETSGERGA